MTQRKTMLLTGASRGIGHATVKHFSAAGWRVLTVSRHAFDGDCPWPEGLANHIQLDLADMDSIDAGIAQIKSRLDGGKLDAIVNNASTFEYDTVETFSYGAMERHWRANTGPPIVLAGALHRHLSARGATGCVVNLLDQKLWNPNPDYFSYTLSKAALQSATVMLAQALAPAVRVCGVAPGVTLPSGPMSAAEFEASHRLTPLQRSSTPEDIARSVRFLLESPAVTGTTLLVDGGQHLQAQSRDVMFVATTDKNH
jgi:NAD(P)-dependent dehydrogenase (short-subunit alcohol dehydrogenase family)